MFQDTDMQDLYNQAHLTDVLTFEDDIYWSWRSPFSLSPS